MVAVKGVTTMDTTFGELPLQEMEMRNTLGLLQSMSDVGIFNMNLDTNELRASPGLLTIWGLGDHQGSLTYADLFGLVHPDDRSRCAAARGSALANKRPYHVAYRIVLADGSTRHIRGEGKFTFDAQEHPIGNVGVAVDVTSHVARDKKILHLLEHDRLTDLMSRNAFIERLQRAILHHDSDEVLGIVVWDIDRFTVLNDTLGSATGDLVLRSFASRLKTLESAGHSIARIGGDEFACVLRGSFDEGVLEAVIADIQSQVRAPFCIAGTPMQVSASMGFSIYPHDGTEISLLERAHLACCRAKSTDLGFLRYAADMEAEVTEKFQLERSLHSAIANHEFELYYQPVVRAADLEIVGVEALIRWNHPVRGLLTPDAFLPTAQIMGVSPFIDGWVLIYACMDGLTLCDRAGSALKLHVNMSAAALIRADFVDIVEAALATTGFPPDLLVIEVTEQSLIVDEADAVAKFARIRSMGAMIAIDDFGTGYNSLHYLKAYAVDRIKIDRSFVEDIETSAFSRGVCAGVMALAKNLKLHVVAEGVETVEQADFLRNLGVDELQGFLYGRPTELAASLQHWARPTA